jgi:tellurite resistance protein TerB
MGLWDSLKQAVGGVLGGAKGFLQEHFNEFNNGDFKEAAMAFAAKITMADGEATSDEKMKMAGIIERHELLALFDASELRSLYLKQLEDFQFDYDFASENIKKKLAKVSDPDQQRGIIMIGIIIGKADGNFDENERAAVREVINLYNHAMSDYDV